MSSKSALRRTKFTQHQYQFKGPFVDEYKGLNPLEELHHRIKKANTLTLLPDKRGAYRGNGIEYRQFDPCVYCGYPANTWDHIEPIRVTKLRGIKGKRTIKNKIPGSRHSSSNLTRACAKCNNEKGSMSALHYLLAKKSGNGNWKALVKQRNMYNKLYYHLTKYLNARTLLDVSVY